MKATEENRFSALVKVQTFLTEKAASLAAVTQIATEKLVLDSYIDGIILNDGIATADTTGYAIAKGNARVALTSAALRMTRATKALAIDTNDPILLKKADYTKSELDKKRDSDLYITSKQISDMVTPLVPALAGYLILPAHLTVLNTNLATYYTTLPQPGGQTDQKVVAGSNVAELLSKAYGLLSTKMDAYLDLFLEDNPDLVEEYYLARAIDDNTGSGGGGGGGGGSTQEFSGSVVPMGTDTVGPITYNAAASMTLSATGPSDLTFQLMSGAVPSGGEKTVLAFTSKTDLMSAFGPAGDSISITNTSAAPAGYSITISA
jgi:hypothetical protein